MKPIIDYSTVCESNTRSLDARVSTLMKEGFQPFGSPYVAQDLGDFNICQAMVKHPADE
jgi:hypothetical protein